MKLIKPKFWDLKKPNVLAYLLLPFTIILIIKNFFLNLKKKKKYIKIKSICIGNIYVGGTGKTPSTIKIYKILQKLKYKTVIGKKKYKNQVDEIAVLKKYSKVISLNTRHEIFNLAINNKNKVIVFDDGLQDDKVTYDLQILCFDTKNLIGNGNLLPSGPLRENINSIKKYDCVLLKDNIKKAKNFAKKLVKIKKDLKIFYTFTSIVNLKNFNKSKKYLIFSGIGNPENFKKILKKNKFNIAKEIIFPDHYNYKSQDLKNIKKEAKKLNADIITTEKDFVKLSKKDQKQIKFVKVEINFINEKNFVKYLNSKINEKI